jgi:hypothetical protein
MKKQVVEQFYEKELFRVTDNTVLKYDHEKQQLADCWIVECTKCNMLDKCKFAVKTDKMSAVIGNSAYKSLMLFRR